MSQPNKPSLSLNVIFHGLCVFVGKKTGIDILLPDLAPEHVFRAGVWLGETNIQPGAELTLQGVTAGDAIFERRLNVMVLPENCDRFPRSQAKPFATLIFPRPNRIYSLRQVALKPGDDLIGPIDYLYKLDDGTILQSSVQVFQYYVPDENQLALTNHRWIPAFVDGVTNLHIFAEPETPQPIGHSIGEFGKGSEMFQGLDLKRTRASILPEFTDVPPGIRKEELEDLIPRTRRMALLGRYRITGEDPALAWDEADPFGGDTTACVWGTDGS